MSLNIVSKEEQEAMADKAGFDIFASWSRPPADGEHPYDKLHMILKKRAKQLSK